MHALEDQPKHRSKLALLLRLLLKNPVEFRDRVLTIAEFQADRLRPNATLASLGWDALVHQVEEHLGGKLHSFLNETALIEIEDRVLQAQRRVLETPVFETYHDADFALGRLCYALCRLQKPEVVVETGVGYGVTSAFLLQALAVNNQGQLWSIDLPPLAQGADAQVGCLVPSSLCSRWHLLRGRTRRLLPPLMAQLSSIDIFLHDSLHTYRNMMWEFRTVWPRLKAGGVLLSDDIHMNRAFEEFAVHSSEVESFAAGKQSNKSSLLGIAIKTERLKIQNDPLLTMFFAHTCRDSRDSRGRGAHLRGDWRQVHLDAGNSHRQCTWLHSELETEQGCAEKFLHALIRAGLATRCEDHKDSKDQCATAFAEDRPCSIK